MKMFGHDHIPDDHKQIAPAYALQNSEKEIATRGCPQHGLTLVTTACDEVQIACAIATLEEFRHMTRIEARAFSKM
jgi:hypothetical protein